MRLGPALQAYRERLSLTRAELALRIGVSVAALGRLERGRGIRGDALAAVLHYLTRTR